MTQVIGRDLEVFRARFCGRTLGPADAGYDEARPVRNGRHRPRRPALTARCEGRADVAAAVVSGREHDLEICVRGAGTAQPALRCATAGK